MAKDTKSRRELKEVRKTDANVRQAVRENVALVTEGATAPTIAGYDQIDLFERRIKGPVDMLEDVSLMVSISSNITVRMAQLANSHRGHSDERDVLATAQQSAAMTAGLELRAVQVGLAVPGPDETAFELVFDRARADG